MGEHLPLLQSATAVSWAWKGVSLFVCLALNTVWAAAPPSSRTPTPAFPSAAPAGTPVVMSPRLITLPANDSFPLFADVDGDGRTDLLAMDVQAKQLLNYRQRPDGFTNSPDQVLPLPPQTVWATVCDLDAHPGLELLFSTPTGLVYSRQNGGRFEAERRPLLQAPQVFTNGNYPFLEQTLSTNRTGTNGFIPVISTNQVVLYHRNAAYEWSPEPPLPLKFSRTEWGPDNEPWSESWTLGSNPGRNLRAEQFFRAKPDRKHDQVPETEALRKLIDYLNKTPVASPPKIERIDVNGDGQKDAVVWQCGGKTPFDFKTDLYVFLRGPDHKLPERPTQALHGRGIPIPFGSTTMWSPVGHLKADKSYQVVLLEFNTRFASSSGLLDAAISHGLNWLITVRSFREGFFSGNPEASVPVKMILPAAALTGWTIFIDGDFNGDGRPDLLVKRSDTQWEVYFSTAGGNWFAPHPSLLFDTPTRGYAEVKDLNGDGLADVIWQEPEEHRVSIYISPQGKSRTP